MSINIRQLFTPTKLLVIAVAVAAIVLGEWLEWLTPLLVFAGPCNDSCADGGGGGGGGGSDGCAGSDTGSSPSSSCGSCASSDSCGSGSTSTPYLYLKTKAGFSMLNDVMVGYPSTYVQSVEAGEAKRRGEVLGRDRYPVALADAALDSNGRATLQLKEIEPEESHIFTLRAHAFSVTPNETIVQSWDHRTLYALSPQPGRYPQRVLLNDRTDVTKSLRRQDDTQDHGLEKERSQRLQKGDTLTFTSRRSDGRYVKVASFWRDWVAGHDADAIHGLSVPAGRASLRRLLFTVSAKTAVLTSLIAGFFIGGQAGDGHPAARQPSDDDLLSLIKKCNTVNVAYADSPHGGGDGAGSEDAGNSLIISYQHPTHGLWVSVGTVLPRAYLPSDVLVALPEEAYNAEGVASLKIEATKSHYVKHIELVAEEVVRELTPAKTIAFARTHTRRGWTVAAAEEHLHMLAGDTVELTTAESVKGYTHLAVELYGYYLPLTEAGRQAAGPDWQQIRNEREERLMQSIYG